MDREVIDQKLESLRRCLQRIQSKCPEHAEQLAAERGGHFLAVDAARIALGDYYERRKQEQGAVQKSSPAGKRKRS